MTRDRGMRRRAIISAGAGLLIQGCMASPAIAFNYRLRVGIVANGEERAAESVIRLEAVNASKEFMNHGNAFRYRAQGEAVVLDIGDSRKPLFALLNGIPYRDE